MPPLSAETLLEITLLQLLLKYDSDINILQHIKRVNSITSIRSIQTATESEKIVALWLEIYEWCDEY